jgi:hypothetical protein
MTWKIPSHKWIEFSHGQVAWPSRSADHGTGNGPTAQASIASRADNSLPFFWEKMCSMPRSSRLESYLRQNDWLGLYLARLIDHGPAANSAQWKSHYNNRLGVWHNQEGSTTNWTKKPESSFKSHNHQYSRATLPQSIESVAFTTDVVLQLATLASPVPNRFGQGNIRCLGCTNPWQIGKKSHASITRGVLLYPVHPCFSSRFGKPTNNIEFVHVPINQSINRSINQSINQSVNQAIRQSMDGSIN